MRLSFPGDAGNALEHRRVQGRAGAGDSPLALHQWAATNVSGSIVAKSSTERRVIGKGGRGSIE